MKRILIMVSFASLIVTFLSMQKGVFAQTYPNKPIRLIVAYPAGGPADILGRTIGQKLTADWGEQVVIDNRGGANGIIASEMLTKAAPDGYTILLVSSAHSINRSLYSKLPYDTIKDFVPVTNLVFSSFILVVNPSVPVKSVQELIRFAKSKPNYLTFGSGGNGSPTHLSGEMLKMMTGIEMTHVPYKGMAPALTDLLGGRLSLIFSDQIVVLPHVKEGRLRPLAVTSIHPSAVMPDLPTMDKSGVPGYESTLWYGILAPASTPMKIVNQLSNEISKILKMEDVQSRLKSLGAVAIGNTPEQFMGQIKQDIDKYEKVIKTCGVRID